MPKNKTIPLTRANISTTEVTVGASRTFTTLPLPPSVPGGPNNVESSGFEPETLWSLT